MDEKGLLSLEDVVRDPSLMYSSWVAHYFPGLTPYTMDDLRWSTYVSMWDSTKEG